MFRSKSNSGGGKGEGDNASGGGGRMAGFASLFFRKKQPKKRKRPEIKLVLGENGGKEEGMDGEHRAKEDKDAANRRIVMIESQSSAASGDRVTSSISAGLEDSNRRAATPSG